MAKNVDVTIQRTTFLNNTAVEGDAGALYLDCEDTHRLNCNYLISHTQFLNNSAKVNGGAIRYTYYKPNITLNNTFTGNTAEYGRDLASYPV